MTILVGSEIPGNRTWHLDFEGTKKKVISILTDTHPNNVQIYRLKIYGWAPTFSLLEIDKRMHFLLYLGLEG